MPALGVPLAISAGAICMAVAALCAVVVYKMARGKIDLSNLIPPAGQRARRIPRLQMMGTSIAAVGIYAAMGVAELGRGGSALPEAPDWLVALLGGSHLIYLGGKTSFRTLLQRGLK
jgi:hypothetical protein